ncbi:hypothetical protein SAMN04489867_0577 [Pedococcus dokdonensis]|uniref:Uncharacterized protein n=1 Tax=Pedococcus dokdonensis TaxID=443156 RepID=A0A1H0MDR6_9MICO|nr:hypothetical protein SAMN04489867_0577 [Pedococcus dokdonensis]
MSGMFTYPRLPGEPARELLALVRDTSKMGTTGVTALASASHPKAAHVATGGRKSTGDDLLRVRGRVLEAVGHWVDGGGVPRNQQPKFDALLGQALHESLEILPADAAHAGTWSFLTLVLLPDVAVTRFTDLVDDRGLGTKRERNVLSRAWMRWDALGAVLLSGDPILGEDELVGLLERSAVARNGALVHELATAVLHHRTGTARSEYARELYKRVRHRTGPLMLDLLTRDELAELVQAEAGKVG